MAAASAASSTRLVATCSDVVKTWELEREPALRPRLEVPAAGRIANQGPWHCVKWNHNNQVLACGGDRGAVALLHESGKVLEVLFEGDDAASSNSNDRGTSTPVVALAWGGRSRYLCTSGGASRQPTLWDLKRKQKLRAFRGHGSSTVTAVAFAPDDSGVASGNNHGEILLHHLQSEEPALVLPFDPSQPPTAGPRGLMSPSAISASVRTVEYWAMRPPLLLAGYRNGDARIWDAAAGACVGTFKGHHQAAITAAVGSPVNNKLLATAGLDRRVLLFDANSRKLLRECRAPAPVQTMAFGPEGDTLVVGCSGGELAVYDLRKPTIPCVSLHAHAGQPVRALAVQGPAAGSASSSSGSVSSGSRVASAAATAVSASSPRNAPAVPAHVPAPKVAAVSPQRPSLASVGTTTGGSAPLSSSKPLSAEPQPPVGSGGAARPLAPSSVNTATATDPLWTAGTTAASITTSTTGLSLRPTATQTTMGAAAAATTTEAPLPPPPPLESGFWWRDELRAASSSSSGAALEGTGAGAGAAVAAGARGAEKVTVTKPSLDVPSLASLSAAAPLAHPQQPGAAASAAPPAPAGGADGGGAAVPAAGAVGVAASPKEVAALVEERVKEVVDEVKDELGRGLKGLHLELLRGQEGMQETVAGLAAAVAALAEENRQLRAELAEMRTLGY